MKEQNNIDEIFKEAFDQFEVDPGSNVWANVQAGINSGAAGSSASAAAGSASSATASWVATAIVGLAISAAAVGGYYFFNQQGEAKVEAAIKAKKQETEQNNKSVQDNSTDKSGEVTKKPSVEALENKPAKEKATTNEQQDNAIINSANELTKKQVDPVRQLSNGSKINVSTGANEVGEEAGDKINAETQKNATGSTNTESSEVTEKNQTNNNTNPIDQSTSNTNEKAENKLTKDRNTTITGVPPIENNEKIEVFINFPNVFSPNQDGTNDEFLVIQERSKGIDQVQEARMIIKDNTGKTVAVWSGINGSWDGTLPNGSNAPSGKYLFQFTYSVNGEPQAPLKDFLTLNR